MAYTQYGTGRNGDPHKALEFIDNGTPCALLLQHMYLPNLNYFTIKFWAKPTLGGERVLFEGASLSEDNTVSVTTKKAYF